MRAIGRRLRSMWRALRRSKELSLLSVVVFVVAGVGAAPASVLLVVVAALMMGVASLAALGPARRTLRVPTIDALRFDG